MNKRVLVLVVTHTVLAAGGFAWGWRVAQGRAGAAAAERSLVDAGPVKPAKLGAAARGKTHVGKDAIAEIGPEDPAEFVVWAKELAEQSGDPFDPFGAEHNPACEQLRALFHRDRDRAVQIAVLARQGGVLSLFNVLVHEWGVSDFPGAVKWANGSDPEVKSAVFERLPWAVTAENAAEAMRLFLPELPRGGLRDQALAMVLNRWSTSDPVSCFAWVQSLPVPDMMRMIGEGASFSDLVKSSPEAVAAFVRALPGNRASLKLMDSIAEDLAASNPSMAIDWARSLEPSGARAECLSTIWSTWAEADLEAATAHALAQTEPEARRRAIETIAEQALEQDQEAAGKWIEALPTDVRLTAEAEAITRLDRPEKAAERLARLLAGEGATAEALTEAAWSTGSELARTDPPQATEWVQGLPAGKAQSQAAAGVVWTWARYDPVATSGWAASLPAGDARDGAARGLADALASSDPEAAFGWAASVGSAAERAEALRDTVDEWKDIDSTAARRTIEASGLAPAEKTALLGQLGRE